MFASVIIKRQVFVDQNSDVSLIRKVKLVTAEYYANIQRRTNEMQIVRVEILMRRTFGWLVVGRGVFVAKLII